MGVIVKFPMKAQHYAAVAAQIEPILTAAWGDRHLPVLAVGLELLGLSEPAFADRIALMKRDGGLGLVAELIHELETTSLDLEGLYRGCYQIRARLRSALAVLEPAGATS